MEGNLTALEKLGLFLVAVFMVFIIWLLGAAGNTHHKGEEEKVGDSDYSRFENDEIICYNFLGRTIDCKWKE